MAPKPKSTVYDDELLREIADFNARYAQTITSPDTAPAYTGGMANDDPDWLDWQDRYASDGAEDEQS